MMHKGDKKPIMMHVMEMNGPSVGGGDKEMGSEQKPFDAHPIGKMYQVLNKMCGKESQKSPLNVFRPYCQS